jgi:hypothetical protein
MSGGPTDPETSISSDNAGEARLRFMLVHWLSSNSAQKIDFWCNGIHVDGAGLMTVYEALLHDKVHVKIDPHFGRNKAAYRPSANTFFFGSADYGDSILEHGLMIHESVHAMVDIAFEDPSAWADDDSARHDRYRPALMMREEEEAAYIAQALFILYEDVYYEVVGEVAEAVRIARLIKGKDEATVTDEMQASLKAAILADPDYQEEFRKTYWTLADGVD